MAANVTDQKLGTCGRRLREAIEVYNSPYLERYGTPEQQELAAQKVIDALVDEGMLTEQQGKSAQFDYGCFDCDLIVSWDDPECQLVIDCSDWTVQGTLREDEDD